MAEKFAAVAVAEPSLMEAASPRQDLTVRTDPVNFADRAERGVQLFSRWAGILAFAGTIAVIVYFVRR